MSVKKKKTVVVFLKDIIWSSFFQSRTGPLPKVTNGCRLNIISAWFSRVHIQLSCRPGCTIGFFVDSRRDRLIDVLSDRVDSLLIRLVKVFLNPGILRE